jgi:anti-sigma-K factor RskA
MREPTFVADPREPKPAPRLARWRAVVAVAAVVVLAAALAWLVFALLGREDPALEVGSAALAAPLTAAGSPA